MVDHMGAGSADPDELAASEILRRASAATTLGRDKWPSTSAAVNSPTLQAESFGRLGKRKTAT